jgi:uncharacterized protein (DUF1697 family)
MTQYVAFLRAVNVAGHARVRMGAVRDAFEEAGCRNVRTYIQSGNVVFESTQRGVGPILQKLRGKLRALLGDEPEILLRTVHEIARVVEEAPFTDRDATSGAKLYVAFLSRTPRRRPALPFGSSKEALEAVAMRDREVFIVSRPKKNGFFGFPNNFIEEHLCVAATSRNWSTVTKIIEFARSHADG